MKKNYLQTSLLTFGLLIAATQQIQASNGEAEIINQTPYRLHIALSAQKYLPEGGLGAHFGMESTYVDPKNPNYGLESA